MRIGANEIMIIAAIALLLFGAKLIPMIAKSFRASAKAFNDEIEMTKKELSKENVAK